MILFVIACALLGLVAAGCWCASSICKADLDNFAVRVRCARTLADIDRLETELNRYRRSHCWFEWNHARCAELIQRLRHMRTIAEFYHG